MMNTNKPGPQATGGGSTRPDRTSQSSQLLTTTAGGAYPVSTTSKSGPPAPLIAGFFASVLCAWPSAAKGGGFGVYGQNKPFVVNMPCRLFAVVET